METSSPDERLVRVLRTATRVFADRGYRRTQMADVAAEVGTSPGNLYNYVESKEALFYACLLAASPDGDGPTAADLPLPTPPAGAIAAAARKGTSAIARGGRLASALAAEEPPEDVAVELAEIIGEFYDRTHASRRFQALIERSARDIPELFDAFFTRMRRPGLAHLTTYLERRIASGHLRQVPDVPTTARLINETQAWFARHRYGDQDTPDVDDHKARATVIDVLVAGLLPRTSDDVGPPVGAT